MKLFLLIVLAPMMIFAAETKTLKTSRTIADTKSSGASFWTGQKMAEKTAMLSTDFVALSNKRGQVGVEVFQKDHLSVGFSILNFTEKDEKKKDVVVNKAIYGVGASYYLLDSMQSKNLFASAQWLISNESTSSKIDSNTGLGLRLGALARLSDTFALSGGLAANNLSGGEFKGEPTFGMSLLF